MVTVKSVDKGSFAAKVGNPPQTPLCGCFCDGYTPDKDTKKLQGLNLDCIREHKSAIDMVTSYSIDKYLIAKQYYNLIKKSQRIIIL